MESDRRPNFLWLNTHDVSAKHLGCYGDLYARTPNLDKLAAEGIRYTNAFTAETIGITGETDKTIPALRGALKNHILWARLRGAAILCSWDRRQLRPMKPLIADLRAALSNSTCFGQEHAPHIESMFSLSSFNAQRDTIVGRWVIGRAIKRIELA